MLQSATYASWFVVNLRCTKKPFLWIASFLHENIVRFAAAKGQAAFLRKIVAVALYFLGFAGGYREVGSLWGCRGLRDGDHYGSRACAERNRPCCRFVPRDHRGWETIEASFALRHGYPGVVGAVDILLIEIEHPDAFDGCYCRKYYPALNGQAIVNMDNLFLSVEVCPSSWSDRKCWQFSAIGRSIPPPQVRTSLVMPVMHCWRGL